VTAGGPIIVAGGGTAGHVAPGLAIAEALVLAGVARTDVQWVGSRRGMEVDAVPKAGFDLTVLPGRGIVRGSKPADVVANVRNVIGLVRAAVLGVWLVGRRKPAAVVSLGGYASVPCAIGAVIWRRPLIIQEQNATPSLANRLVARFAVLASVPVAGTGLKNERVTGNPVSEAVRAAALVDSERARVVMNLPSDGQVIAVFGGSLGSRRINHVVLDLAERWSDRTDVAIYHVIGRRDWPELGERIRALAVETLHYQAVEYETQLPEVIVAADLAVCRSGGMTIAELSVLGCPAILVPLPIAPNDAQRVNAKAMEDAGAAVVISDADLDVDCLERELNTLLEGGLDDAAAAAKSLGRPDAADEIAAAVLSVASGGHPKRTDA